VRAYKPLQSPPLHDASLLMEQQESTYPVSHRFHRDRLANDAHFLIWATLE
jgi:hypothetical protein